MRAVLSGVIGAIEAVAVALATLLIVVLCAFLIWWWSFGLSAEPSSVMAIAGGTWLLAHLVPLTVDLPLETMQLLGFAPERLRFVLSLAPLGLTLGTVAFAARAGWRFGGRGGPGVTGVLGGTVGFGIAAAVLHLFVPFSALSAVLTALIPALVYGVPAVLACVIRAARDEQQWWQRAVELGEVGLGKLGVQRSAAVMSRAAEALRLSAMLIAAYVGVAGIALGAALLIGYADVTAVSQSLQLDGWGVTMMFVVQLAFLPVFVLWSGAWMTGAGFELGTGSSVSPFGALLGPVPGLPVFSAIPDGWGALAVFAPTLLVLVGVVMGLLLGETARRRSAWGLLGIVVPAVLVAGLGIALLTWISSGSLGPGRLADTGGDAWVTAGLASAELGVGTLLGAYGARANLLAKVPAVPLRREHPHDELWTADVGPLRPLSVPELSEPEPSEPEIPQIPTITPVEPVREPDSTEFDSVEFDDAETVEVEPTDVAYPVREPELFDQQVTTEHETVEVPEPASETGPGEAAAELDEEALIEAYSWDHQEEPPSTEEHSTGWRWPRRKG